MDFAFTSDQEALRSAVRGYLRDRFPIERVVELAGSDEGWDPATWKDLAYMGWLDGAGLSVLDLAVVAEEAGYALLPAPWFSTVGRAWPLLDSELREGVIDGEQSVTLACSGEIEVERDALTGIVPLVADLTSATVALVVTAGSAYAVDLTSDLVIGRSTMDRTRRLGELRLDRTPARRLPIAGARLHEALADSRRRSLVLAACEAIGVTQRVLEIATEHVKTREQFGRVIGTYQGVSHQIADMFVSLQLGRSLTYWAAWAVSEGEEQQDLAAAAAKASAADGAVVSCERAIQVHGGIGFSYEHVLHRYYKRAQWLAAFEGHAAAHRAHIAAELLRAGREHRADAHH